ncbi:hypothetical protein G4D82_08930 [Flavobacterium sp. CYK-4]|uniref:hypothetical protein n=1 Tax=Flavobacterium lotistagni TaxID=2709660 RepID=UPI00140BF427|nr:hypothetical protein [Flavobacterium lotistagni]NHM07342.1 hypothetical protein [Flavobacterium lotistagni]
MTRSKIYKIAGGLALVGILAVVVVYYRLPNRHKAIVKTYLLHHSGWVKNDWEIDNHLQRYLMASPEFYIDGIYKSMEGPKSSNYVQLSPKKELLWITGFHVKALNANNHRRISNDFICHTNIDFNDVRYFSNFHLEKRIGKQYPRMTSLSHGQEDFTFPRGYGVPMQGNDLLFVTTESLNHNIADARFFIRHEVEIDYATKANTLKPLMSRTVYIMLPYDKIDPFKSPIDPGKGYCIPVETKNHSYDDGQGNKLSGHWVIPPGKSHYRSSVDTQLQMDSDSIRLHAAAVHVHPFSTSLTLWDKTAQKAIFQSKIKNHKNKIGLEKIDAFSSEEGIWMFRNHQYELVLEANNTTNINQDMMGSMFLFFYDQELDAILHKK